MHNFAKPVVPRWSHDVRVPLVPRRLSTSATSAAGPPAELVQKYMLIGLNKNPQVRRFANKATSPLGRYPKVCSAKSRAASPKDLFLSPRKSARRNQIGAGFGRTTTGVGG